MFISLLSLANSLQIFSVFEDGLSKPAVVAMAEDSISTSGFVLGGLFGSFGEETISDDSYVRNYKLHNETDHDRGRQ